MENNNEYLFEIYDEPILMMDRAPIHNNRISISNSNREYSPIMYLAEADTQLCAKWAEILRDIHDDDALSELSQILW